MPIMPNTLSLFLLPLIEHPEMGLEPEQTAASKLVTYDTVKPKTMHPAVHNNWSTFTPINLRICSLIAHFIVLQLGAKNICKQLQLLPQSRQNTWPKSDH
jgi:hypothetical protein